MLPDYLHGPDKTIGWEPPRTEAFVRCATTRHPFLDPDFIKQICYEHPSRFDDYFPLFAVQPGCVVRRLRTASWIDANVKDEESVPVDMWCDQFDQYLEEQESFYSVFTEMLRDRTWPFPPVIVEHENAIRLGAKQETGAPFAIVEGWHRVSYLRRMLQLGMIEGDSLHEVLELQAPRSEA